MTGFTQDDAVQRYVQNTLDLYSRLGEERQNSAAVIAAVDKAEEVLGLASARVGAERADADLAVARSAWVTLARAIIDQIKGRAAG